METRRTQTSEDEGFSSAQQTYDSPLPRAAGIARKDVIAHARAMAIRLTKELCLTPLEMVVAGRIVRLRLHLRHMARHICGRADRFEYRGRQLLAVDHSYNRTWLNERRLELAAAADFLDRLPAGAIGLEVGNVLAHYRPVDHEVVDKYENAPGVDNTDVVDIATGARYQFIVAISTLEHVGWDEAPREPDKAVRALRHLRSLLLPGGTLLLTAPLGYNHALDAELLLLDVPGAETYVLDRAWRWRRRPAGVRDLLYHHHLHTAQAIWIGEIPADRRE